jgi:hypothetical protein
LILLVGIRRLVWREGNWGRTELLIVFCSFFFGAEEFDVLLQMVFAVEIGCETGDGGDGSYGGCGHVAFLPLSLPLSSLEEGGF